MDNRKLVLKIDNLSVQYKVYEGILEVIPGLSLEVREGERVGLIGETGCGKTTVLKSVAAVLRCPPAIIRKGGIEVCGMSIDSKAGVRNVRRSVAMIFQDPSTSLNPTLKISTQMKDILSSQFHLNKAAAGQKMLDALKAVSMPAPERVLDSYPVQLSGGMRQRVCIAMALMKDSELIMADEPTTALDVTIEEQILDLLNVLVREQNKSLILVSHALGAVRKITDRICVMYAGNVVESGSTEQVFSNPRHPYTVGLMAATPKLTGEGIADGIAGDIPSYISPPKGCRFADRCEKATDECRKAPPVLRPLNETGDWQVACHHA
ncbi:Oligopeptide transport ATP-binding protein OppD [bioreactor metagenome]|uniref:Nickel import system ATP-binding protein NikD n=1 Tax=bioreactor metagenome TaxID=1076179 RepID=A0A644VP61_9ZZZZ